MKEKQKTLMVDEPVWQWLKEHRGAGTISDKIQELIGKERGSKKADTPGTTEGNKSIPDNTFAAACYDQNSIEELIEALTQDSADKTDCETWKITPEQWKDSIAEALRQKIRIQDLKDAVNTLKM